MPHSRKRGRHQKSSSASSASSFSSSEEDTKKKQLAATAVPKFEEIKSKTTHEDRKKRRKDEGPCNFTQERLIELLQKNNGTPNYSLYFFNVAHEKGDWESRESHYNDDLDRCKVCGMRIDEHRAATSGVIPATADDILGAAKGHFEFKVPQGAMCFRIGRGGFDTEVDRQICGCDPTENQKSKALVLMSASGVGKTFATMTFRACSKKMSKRQGPPYECLTIYLGLNQGWGLSSHELAYLQKKGFLEVQCVLLQRLLIALDVTLTECQGGLDSLNEKGHDGQKIPLPRGGTVPFFSEIDVESVREAIYARLRSLLKLCPKSEAKHQLVVLVALDEAQVLDEWISPDKNGGGARYGMRVLRQLQVLAYEATNRQCLLLPIATGIRPAVSLSNATEGTNKSVGEKEDDAAHVSFADFRTIVRNRIESLSPDKEFHVGKAVNLLSAAFYPCVRRALSWELGEEVSPIDAGLEITADDAVKILLADFARTLGQGDNFAVELNLIPQQIPVTRIADDVAQPLVHFCVFRALWRRIKNKQRDLPGLPLGTVNIYDSSDLFETRMFQVFGLFMSIFCDPRAPTEKFRTIVHPRINEWLPKGAWMLEARCHNFVDDSKKHYLPFARHTNHEDACKGPLFDGVLSHIQNLQKDCAVWMVFGAEAPVDYMLFVRRGNRMEVRYGDAKHRTERRDDLPSQQRAVVRKAGMIHDGLKEQLDMHGLSLEDFDEKHVLLFTNVPTDTAVSPNTFCWSSWTPFVFQDDDDTGTCNAQSGPQESAP